jgi:hypothetical protein
MIGGFRPEGKDPKGLVGTKNSSLFIDFDIADWEEIQKSAH